MLCGAWAGSLCSHLPSPQGAPGPTGTKEACSADRLRHSWRSGGPPAAADDDSRLLGARHADVEQVPVVLELVGFVRDNDGTGILRSLASVEPEAVGELQFAHLVGAVFNPNSCAVEVDPDAAVRQNLGDDPDRPVHDADLVVVPGLDHLVVEQEAWRGSVVDRWRFHPVQLPLDQLLQINVQ